MKFAKNNKKKSYKKSKYLADFIKLPTVTYAVEYQSDGETFEITMWKTRSMIHSEVKERTPKKCYDKKKNKYIYCGYMNHNSKDYRRMLRKVYTKLKIDNMLDVENINDN
uniref:GIY-YIG domain-containing protein n=1 Tax=Strongyloides stercoralis TaxID=6248 RepID=A0A0K0EH24_STRER